MKKIRNSRLSSLIKIGIFIIAATYIFFMLQKKEGFSQGFFNSLFTDSNFLDPLFILAFILFPVNWAFETLKWSFLVRQVEHINFFKAYRGILTGVTFGMITPFSIGDYIGRILQLSGAERIKVVGAIFLSRIAQFFITLIFGAASMAYFILEAKEKDSFVFLIAIFATVASVGLLLLFLYHRLVMSFIKNISFFSPVYKYFEILNKYSHFDIFKVVLFSFLRYMVFSIQFILLLMYFKVSEDLNLLCMGVAFVFLVKSIVPTILDLGVREAAAIYFFTAFGLLAGNEIMYASLCLWIINILLPAFVGMFLIFKIKLITK